MKTDYTQPLYPDNFYHVFSRAIGNEKLFLSHENYHFFLRKLQLHTALVCSVYCYALLPNHFHLLIHIKPESSIIAAFELVKKKTFSHSVHNLSDFVMERFSNFLNSYAKAFNKAYRRKGALFMDYLKRAGVKNDADMTAFIWYIHKNAVHHGLASRVGEWDHDSYLSILSQKPTKLLRKAVIDWFGNKEQFLKFHRQEVVVKMKLDEP
jgi:putative transposase